MKLLYIITGLGVGGAERQVLDLADSFHTKGYKVKICFLTGDALLRPKNEEVEIIGLHLKKNIWGLMQGFRLLRSVIKDFSPDVVHAHMVHANLFSRLIRPVCSIKKLITTAHNTNEGGSVRMLAYRATHFLADISTNVTIEAVRAFEEKGACPPNSMLAIPNGIDIGRFKFDTRWRSQLRAAEGVSENDKLIVAVGRLVDAKDYVNLIKAFRELSHDMPEAKLWIVGEGNERAVLTDLVISSGLSDKVRFLGVRSDVHQIYNAADLYVLSSAWEGFGLVVAEAMASEQLVVATDCGGVKEVLGGHGYLVPAKDSPALALAMQTALRLLASERALITQAARHRILENYSLNTIVNMWERLYRS